MKPNLSRPGDSVTSARAGTTNHYTDMSGCSMATPHVSGIAATLMEHYPDFRDRPHLLRAHLMASTVLHREEVLPANNNSGGRNDFGLGRLSDYSGALGPPQQSERLDGALGVVGRITNNRWGFWDLDVPRGTDRLVLVMAWDEPAASSGAAPRSPTISTSGPISGRSARRTATASAANGRRNPMTTTPSI